LAVRIRELAPGKINLCLFLGPVRGDGRHELVTLFESVSLADELVISTGSVDEVVAPGVEGPNLVSDAVAGLRRLGWAGPPLRIEIDKRIPVAAGMGGGSADAAALLRVAPRIAAVDAADVAELAASLGADVPAQLTPGVALGTGAGHIVAPRAPLAPHAVMVVQLAAQLATPAVYAEADRLGLPRSAEELDARGHELEAALARGGRLTDALTVNDLGAAACSLCPAIEEALARIREAGADHALVCGSGPTAIGIFWGADAEARAGEAVAGLAERFPRATVALPVSSPS
jgi:4-diphosphocytidyl-2-C-methyl-D-erythritol kinase